MERNRRPPDVDEALSSMLWTPYQRTPSDSSDDENFEAKTRTKSQMKSRFTVPDLYSITEQHLYAKPIRYPNSCATTNYGYFMPKSYNSLNCQLPSYEHIEKERTRRRFSEYFLTSNRMTGENEPIDMGATRNNGNVNSNNNNNHTTINNNYNNNTHYTTIAGNNNDNYNSATNYTLDNNSNNNCLSNGIFLLQQQSKYPTSMVHSFTDNFLQHEVMISNLTNFAFFLFNFPLSFFPSYFYALCVRLYASFRCFFYSLIYHENQNYPPFPLIGGKIQA